MATGAGRSASRDARERTRAYQARQEFHAGLVARRRRDNLIAGLAGGAIVLAVVGGQIAYFTVGPGAPSPAPSPALTPSPAPSAAVTETPAPAATSSPTP